MLVARGHAGAIGAPHGGRRCADRVHQPASDAAAYVRQSSADEPLSTHTEGDFCRAAHRFDDEVTVERDHDVVHLVEHQREQFLEIAEPLRSRFDELGQPLDLAPRVVEHAARFVHGWTTYPCAGSRTDHV